MVDPMRDEAHVVDRAPPRRYRPLLPRREWFFRPC
jgi:hypothetical protein